MGKIRTVLLAALLLVTLGTDAFPFCFEEAGQQYSINPQILRAIAKVESNFNPAAINMNTNGTYDFGLMQINSSWAATIGKERWKELGDACTNVKTGAWILSMCMNKYGYTWKAIGCYNSQTPDKRDKYAKMVFNQLQHVKPVAQEASYAPLKDNIEELIRQRVDGWVDSAAQGKKTEFAAKIPVSALPIKEVHQDPPSLTDSSLQSSLPGESVPQNSFSVPDAGKAEAEGSVSNPAPGATP
jgi:hypothetical protein